MLPGVWRLEGTKQAESGNRSENYFLVTVGYRELPYGYRTVTETGNVPRVVEIEVVLKFHLSGFEG